MENSQDLGGEGAGRGAAQSYGAVLGQQCAADACGRGFPENNTGAFQRCLKLFGEGMTVRAHTVVATCEETCVAQSKKDCGPCD